MKNITTILLAGALVLIVSVSILYGSITFFPALMEEYYNSVFRSNSFTTDLLFYVHPFILSAAMFWFWEISKELFTGSFMMRAYKVGVSYGLIAMVPVLWLTFSAIDISPLMVFTWVAYGVLQAFIACLVFAKRNP
ncbi:MAG: hypothetical protein ABL895_04740 [Cyclobacteriaceae bacterium]